MTEGVASEAEKTAPEEKPVEKKEQPNVTVNVTVEPKVQEEPAKPKSRWIKRGLVACFKPIVWLVTLPFSFRKSKIDQITLYSVQPGFFFWFPICMGFTLSALVRYNPEWAGVCGWICAWSTIWFLVTVVYDLNIKRFALWTVVFLCAWFGLKYVEHLRNVVIVGGIMDHLKNLNPKLDPGMASFLSWVLLIPFFHAVYLLFAFGRKRFTPNEIGEYHFGDGEEMSDRQGVRFRTKYRDLLETLLTFGGGDIIALDNHHNEIKRYPNVLFLAFRWKKLEGILQQRCVVEAEDGE
jgi:hypothetical protein